MSNTIMFKGRYSYSLGLDGVEQGMYSISKPFQTINGADDFSETVSRDYPALACIQKLFESIEEYGNTCLESGKVDVEVLRGLIEAADPDLPAYVAFPLEQLREGENLIFGPHLNLEGIIKDLKAEIILKRLIATNPYVV